MAELSPALTGPAPAAESTPGAVLFACTLNRVRSPMAAGLMRGLFGRRVFVDSCGLRADPGAVGPDPFAAAVMDEVGVDLADHRSKTFADLAADSFDVVISLTPEAQHHAVEMARRRAIDLDYWPILDPTLAGGSRAQILAAYRQVRDDLQARILRRFRLPPTFGG